LIATGLLIAQNPNFFARVIIIGRILQSSREANVVVLVVVGQNVGYVENANVVVRAEIQEQARLLYTSSNK